MRLYKFKKDDGFNNPFGYSDPGVWNNRRLGASYASACRDHARDYSKKSVVAASKADAIRFIAEKLGVSAYRVRKDYLIRWKGYRGKKPAGSWVYDDYFYDYR